MKEHILVKEPIMADETASAPPGPHKGSSLIGDTVKLATGTLLAQLLTVAVAPVLSRLYTPEAFGALALYFSVVNIVSETAALRYDLSIVLPETDDEAANQLALALIFILAVNLLNGLFFALFGAAFATGFNTPGLAPLAWALAPGSLAGALFLAFNYWNTRNHRFGWLSTSTVINSLVMISVQLLVGLLGDHSARGLVIGSFLGSAVSALVLALRSWFTDRQVFLRTVRLLKMRQGFIRYQKFPRYDLGGALLSLLSWQMPPMMLALFFSSATTGYYSMGMRLLQVPMRVIGLAFGQSLFPRFNEARAQGSLAQVTESAFRRLVQLTLLPLLALALVGRSLFSVVFGAEWSEAGVFAQILSVWIFFWFISFPLGTVFNVLEKQEYSLRLNWWNFVTRVIALGIGGYFHNLYLALALLSVSGIAVYGFFSLALLTSAGVPFRRVLQIIAAALLRFLPFGIILLALDLLKAADWAITLAAGLVLLLHLGLYFRQDEEFWQYLTRMLPLLNRLRLYNR